MSGRLIAILLCTAFIGAGLADAQTALVSGTAAPLGVQTPSSSAPADTAAPAMSAPDTMEAEPPPRKPAVAPGAGLVVVYGQATLSNGMPLPEVSVSLFAGGLEAATAVTDTSGAYSMRAGLNGAADETVVMWLTPPRGLGLVRDIVVLRESRASRDTRQFNACVTRVPLSDSTLVNVQILDQQSYATKIEESGCMEQEQEEIVEYDLRYDLKAGQSFTLTTSSSDRFVQQFGGTEMAVKSTSSVSFLATVDSVTADGMTLALEYRDRRSTTDNPEARGGIDFAPLLGRKVSVLLSPRGDLSKFTGFEALPEIQTGPERALDAGNYVNEMKMIFPTLADGTVAAGDTWSSEHVIRETMAGGASTATVNTTYKLIGETTLGDLDCLQIDAKSTVTVKGQGENRGTPFSMNMSGSGTSTIYFSPERGMMLEMTGKSRAEGSIDSMGMKIPIVDEGEMKVAVALE